MKLTAYHHEDVFAQFKPEWNALLARSVNNHIFCTWEWQATWWQAYGGDDSVWVVACHTDAGELVALAPWFIQTMPDGERVVRTIGCVDVTDYVDVLVDPDHADVVYDLLAEHLAECRSHFDRINLCNIPEVSPTSAKLGDALRARGFTVEIELQEVCPVIELPDSYVDYINSLDKKQRHELKRKVRRAEGEATLDWYIVGPEHQLDTELEHFLDLMAASQKEKAEFLQDERNVRFFRTLTPRAFEQGWLQLNFLTINGEAAAAYLNFDYQDHILVYNSGLNPDAYGHLSPGIVLLAYNIRHAIETGHKVYDFLRGNETYKYRMGGQDTRVFMLKAHHAA